MSSRNWLLHSGIAGAGWTIGKSTYTATENGLMNAGALVPTLQHLLDA